MLGIGNEKRAANDAIIFNAVTLPQALQLTHCEDGTARMTRVWAHHVVWASYVNHVDGRI